MDKAEIREQLPVLRRRVAGRPLIYADNAATALKPDVVNQAVLDYYSRYTANTHRATHLLSQEASEAFERARQAIARFIGARDDEVIFTKSATDAVNLVAEGLDLAAGDNVVGSVLEHHSNILPWSSKCEYRAVALDPSGLPSLAAAEQRIDEHTRMVAITHCSNVTGVVVPVEEWVRLAHAKGVPILVDGAQSVAHSKIDVGALGCDFLVFSGHKLFGPTGVGVLYGKTERLEALRITRLGGGAVSRVRLDGSYTLREIPWRFESGTPPIASAIGLRAAVEWLEQLGMAEVHELGRALRQELLEQLASIPKIVAYHPPAEVEAVPMLSFRETSGKFPPDFLSRMLSDSFGIMARGGHHCAHPLHESFGVDGSLRISLQFYNTVDEISAIREALASLLRFTPSAST